MSLTSLYRRRKGQYDTYGRRAFSVAGPTVWNSLPDFISADYFRRLLKTYMYLFARYCVHSAR